jgi:hypothetical protein
MRIISAAGTRWNYIASATQPSSPVDFRPSKERQAMQDGRIERRVAMGFVAKIEKTSDPSGTETVWIDNVSSQGARVLARQSRPTNDLVILSSTRPGFQNVVAKVIYCQHFPNGVVAIGVEFDGANRVPVLT